MIAAILLSPVVGVPLTPAYATAPVLKYECRLVDERLRPLALSFRVEGGRGYWAAPGVAKKTKLNYVFLEDGTNEFRSLNAATEVERVQPADPFETTPRTARFESDDVVATIAEVQPYRSDLPRGGWKSSLVVAVGRRDAVTYYTGFCDVQTQAQEPLTESETRKVLGK